MIPEDIWSVWRKIRCLRNCYSRVPSPHFDGPSRIWMWSKNRNPPKLIQGRTTLDNNPQNTSKTRVHETSGWFVHHVQDFDLSTVSRFDMLQGRAKVLVSRCNNVKSRFRSLGRHTHHKKRNNTVVSAIITDQAATANICSLRFLGMRAGANLIAENLGTQLRKRWQATNSILEWIIIGFNCLTDNFESLSFSEEFDRDREALCSFVPTSMLGKWDEEDLEGEREWERGKK